MKKILLIPLLASAMTLQACPGPISLGTPPQLPSNVQTISRSALNFAFKSFDAGLYAFDLAMDLGRPAPGSDKAKAISAAGRKVLAFLNAAESARRAGNAASYEAAFADAERALDQFRTLLGRNGVQAGTMPLQPIDRAAVLERAIA